VTVVFVTVAGIFSFPRIGSHNPPGAPAGGKRGSSAAARGGICRKEREYGTKL